MAYQTKQQQAVLRCLQLRAEECLSLIHICTSLSQIQGIPNGLVFPFGFGMSLRLTGFGRYPC